ncbi:MAG: DUF4363 family protein [Methylocystaceae bacterium]
MKSSWLRVAIAYAIPILILAASIWSMTLEPSKKQTRQFTGHMQKIEKQVTDKQWEAAMSESKSAQKIYHSAVPRIQFSMERDEMKQIDMALIRLQAYIKTENQAGAVTSAMEAREHWLSLNR